MNNWTTNYWISKTTFDTDLTEYVLLNTIIFAEFIIYSN